MTRVKRAAAETPPWMKCLHCRSLIPYTLQPEMRSAHAARRSADLNRCREDGLDVGICVGSRSAPKAHRGSSDPSGDCLCRECRQCRQIQKESGYWGEYPVVTSRIRNRSNIPKMPTFPTLPTLARLLSLRSLSRQRRDPVRRQRLPSAFRRLCSRIARREKPSCHHLMTP